jgi:predicted dehydrogenase
MHPEFEFVGAFDTDKRKRIDFESNYEAPTFNNLTKGLNVTKPDLVVVAVPTQFHLEVIQTILNVCLPKLILCEKPLAYRFSDGVEIISLTKANRVGLFVNYFRNSDPLTFTIKQLVEEGKFLVPFEGICRYNKGLLHTGSHFLNLLEVIFGKAELLVLGASHENRFYQSDPNQDVFLEFSKGRVALIPEQDASELVFAMELSFRNGKLSYVSEGLEVEFYKSSVNSRNEGTVLRNSKLNSNALRYQYDVFQEIFNFLEQKPFRLCTGDEALRYVGQLNAD